MEFPEVNRYLLGQARELLSSWLPGGKISGREFECGDISGSAGKSFKVNIETGMWADFATGQKGGDLISLYAAIHGLDQGKAKDDLCREHRLNGYGGKSYPATTKTQALPQPRRPEPAPIDSVPTMVHNKLGTPTQTWPYVSADGKSVLMYEARYEVQGEKQFLPWSYINGLWTAKAPQVDRPVYNMPAIAAHSDRHVLICEGAKACDAAQALMKTLYVCTTWPMGAKAYNKVDWSPLAGRSVLIWPDADAPGRDAAYGIADILTRKHGCQVKVIDVSDINDGSDAADWTGTRTEFLAWAKPRAKEYELPALVEVKNQDSLFNAQACKVILPHQTAGGKPLGTYENYKALCAFAGVTVRYDVIKKRTEIIIPGHSFSYGNSHVYGPVVLTSWAVQVGLSTTNLYDYLARMAEENQFNPVSTWIQSTPWDGTDRLADLYATVTVEPEYEAIKQTFIKRWLISAVAAAYRPNGFAAQGVLVFQGNQGLGKTRWFKKLVPHDLDLLADGRSLNPHDKDSVLGSVQYWLVELAELDATFRKSDIAALKAFLTRDFDVIRKPYARGESHLPRKTVFFASVNPSHFLSDETGNRRYWTIPCVDINYEHDINMQQLWAQLYELYKQNEQHWLASDEINLLTAINSKLEQIDPIFEALEDLPWQDGTAAFRPMTSTEVLKLINWDRIGVGECRRCVAALKKLGAKKTSNTRQGSPRFMVPIMPQYGA